MRFPVRAGSSRAEQGYGRPKSIDFSADFRMFSGRNAGFMALSALAGIR
jgi:hypothetical protein